MTALPKNVKGKGSDEPFLFPTSLLDDDGDPIEITVPSLAVVKPNSFRMHLLRKEDRTGFLVSDYLLKLSFGDTDDYTDLLELLATLPGEEAERFQQEWRDHSGVSLGESRAS